MYYRRSNRSAPRKLCHDVCDEVARRTDCATGHGAHVEFHPKRYEARRKLRTLPERRLQDLSSDIRFELLRRNPQLNESMSYADPITTSGYIDFVLSESPPELPPKPQDPPGTESCLVDHMLISRLAFCCESIVVSGRHFAIFKVSVNRLTTLCKVYMHMLTNGETLKTL
ncbi:hypothetical protein OBBRIDRAFT_480262 [Obba rivulosa]|uniref:GIT Spa2 homology (SHD) domain-containing protein n=1 Tax=Obba rivulosa TaxID=1052685 RepID=A0A8E2DKZ8_9APHY|nr:hypothetical protein OBBRIDRAFT_480262 [Obba rivulosa]